MGPDDSCVYEPTGDQPLFESPHATTFGQVVPLTLEWTVEAQARVKRIPSFVRGVVTTRVEAYARERGIERIDEALMQEVRAQLPGDFSKRLPFFLRPGGRA